MYNHFSKKEVIQFVLNNIYSQPVDLIKKMCGIYDFSYNRAIHETSFMLIDGLSHSWQIKITPFLLEICEN